jgi:peptide methionine sulfoxide reductase MsrA
MNKMKIDKERSNVSYHQQYLAKNPHGYDCHANTGLAYPGLG